MKKLILLILATVSSLGARTYEEAREELKERLYKCQHGLMGREEYDAFIESRLAQAEKELGDSLEAVKKNPDSYQSQHFFNTIIDYNIASFNDYACPSATSKDAVERHKARMVMALGDLKAQDPSRAAHHTTQLLDAANKEYYAALLLAVKGKIIIGCLISKIR